MSTLMKKHLSRREMQRRMEQGRQAMRVLAAVVVEAGGTLRVSRDVFEGLPPTHQMSVERDPHTGDLVLRADTRHRQELTFEELQKKYGARPAESRPTEEADPAGVEVGSPDGVVRTNASGETGG